jgi:hypothetical protein
MRLQIDDEAKLGGLFHGQIRRLSLLDDFVRIGGGAPEKTTMGWNHDFI